MELLFADLGILEMFQSPVSLKIMSVSIITNISCALVGCFLVLRRMSLMGDAIAHAVLPGLVLAFLFSGSLNIVPLFIGAVLVGFLTTFLTQTLHNYGRIGTDASMGVVFTSLFAIGVILIKRYISGVHFDVACVYQGSLLNVALDTVSFLGYEVPRGLTTVVPICVLNIVVISVFWKEFKISSFDPGLSTALGFSAGLMHYLLMALVALTTVASFESVGSILVVAMLIIPAAAAHLLTDRLGPMMFISATIGAMAAVIGTWLARVLDVETAGTMSVVVAGIYLLAVLFSPRYGVMSTLIQNSKTTLRILGDDLLAMLFRVEELQTDQRLTEQAALTAIDGGFLARLELFFLKRQGCIEETYGNVMLTEKGRRLAKKLVRSHRLWEAFLVEYLGLPLDHVHDPAHRVEHFITEQMRTELEHAIQDATQDPHGRKIPENQ